MLSLKEPWVNHTYIESQIGNIDKISELIDRISFLKNILYRIDILRRKQESTFYYEKIIICLIKLAEVNLMLGDEHDDLNFYVKAFLYYKSAEVITKNKQVGDLLNVALKERLIKAFFEKIKVIDSKTATESFFQQNAFYLQTLKEIIKGIQIALPEKIDAENESEVLSYYETVKTISQTSQENIKSLLIKIILESKTFLNFFQLNDTDYCFASMGSLAKQVATPFSDIEFTIFIKKNDGDIKNKLLVWCYLINLKIIDLGYSLIPLQELTTSESLHANFDDLLEPGLQLDLGGKTPLGRADKGYSLIQTPQEMLQYFEPKWFLVDRLLPTELMHCQFLFGEMSLLEDFNKACSESEIVKFIKDEIVGTNIVMDLYSYDPRINQVDKIGRLFSLKKDLYRLPIECILNLAHKYNYNEINPYSVLQKLSQNKIISNESEAALNQLITLVTYLRLSTYLHHQQQKEVVHFRETQDANYKSFAVNKAILSKINILLMPLFEFFKNTGKSLAALYAEENLLAKGEFSIRFGDYEKAIRLLEPGVSSGEINKYNTDDKIRYYQLLGLAYSCIQKNSKSHDYYKEALKHANKKITLLEKNPNFNIEHLIILKRNYANALGNLAGSLFRLNKFEEALPLYEKTRNIHENFHEMVTSRKLPFNINFGIYVDLAQDCFNIGATYSMLNDKAKAYQEYEKSYKFLKDAQVDSHPLMAQCIARMAAINKMPEKILVLQDALAIMLKQYGHYHPEVAECYISLAIETTNLEQAIEYIIKAWDICEVVYEKYYGDCYKLFFITEDIIKRSSYNNKAINAIGPDKLMIIISCLITILKYQDALKLIECVKRTLAKNDIRRLQALLNEANIYLQLEQDDTAKRCYQSLEAELTKISPSNNIVRLKLATQIFLIKIEMNKINNIAFFSDSYKILVDKIEKLIVEAGKNEDYSDDLLARLYVIRGDLFIKANLLKKFTLDNYIYAYQLRETYGNFKLNPLPTLSSLVSIGRFFVAIRAYQEAGEYFLEALIRGKQVLFPSHVALDKIKIMLVDMLNMCKVSRNENELVDMIFSDKLDTYRAHGYKLPFDAKFSEILKLPPEEARRRLNQLLKSSDKEEASNLVGSLYKSNEENPLKNQQVVNTEIKTLEGYLPDTSTPIHFEETKVLPNGDCGFIVLGIDRSKAIELLASLRDDISSRELLSTEIHQAFFSDEIAATETWRRLLNNRINEQALYDKLKNTELDEGKIKYQREKIDNAEKILIDYCKELEAYDYYISAFLEGLWLGYQSAILCAKAGNFTLYIWDKSEDSNQLSLKEFYIAPQPQQVIHMLHTDGHSHFNILIEHKKQQTQLQSLSKPTNASVASNKHTFFAPATESPTSASTNKKASAKNKKRKKKNHRNW